MKFAALFTATVLGFASSVFADSEQFSMLTIHSASRVHYNYVVNEDGKLYVGPYTNGTQTGPSVIEDSGKLRFGDKYAVLQDDGTFTLGTADEATVSFSISGNHVVLNCKDSFSAVPVGDKYVLSTKGSNDSIGVALRATGNNGLGLDDFNLDACAASSSVQAPISTSPASSVASSAVASSTSSISAAPSSAAPSSAAPSSAAPSSAAPSSAAPSSAAPSSAAPSSAAPSSAAPSTTTSSAADSTSSASMSSGASSSSIEPSQTGGAAHLSPLGLGMGAMVIAALL